LGFEKRIGKARRRHRADGIAVPTRVLGRDEPLVAPDADADGAALALERRGKSLVDLGEPNVATPQEEIVQLVGGSRRPAKLSLHLLERSGVDEVAELLLAQELAQEVAVEGERLRAPLGEGRVVLVHVRRDVVEEEGSAERRGRGRLDLHEVEAPRLEVRQEPPERREVEDVLEAFPVGLEHDGEVRVAAGDLEEALRLETLLPQRRPLARAPPWDEERSRGVLAEA
jgi:hypothetical protein